MKKLLLLSLVCMLLLVSTVPAIPVSAGTSACADVSTLKGTLRFALAGRVRGVDTVNDTVTVEILVGNRIAKKCLGEYIVLTTSAATRFLYSGGRPSAITNLSWGDPVSANGKINKLTGAWEARRITEGAALLSK